MRISINSIKQQIVLLLVALVLVTALGIQLTSWWSANSFNKQQIQERIQNAEDILNEYIITREELLNTAATVLTADFGFKSAVATEDNATLRSMLDNHSMRINADVMMLTEPDGTLIASSGSIETDKVSLDNLISSLQITPNRAQLVSIDDRLYQLIIQPVMAPRLVAYTMIGFEINEHILNKLSHLTMMELSFLTGDKLLLSSVDLHKTSDDFLAALNEEKYQKFFWSRPAFVNNEVLPLTSSNNPVTIILTADLRPIYQEYDSLALNILAVTSTIMLITIICGMFFAKHIASPIRALVKVADKFSRGDYQQSVEIDNSTVEITSLSDALRFMGQNIQARENQILYQAEHDRLTGLYNDQKLRDMLDIELPTMHQSMQIAFYIENFRQINDQLGPDFANTCLQVVAERLQQSQYPLRQFHARMSGVEFISVFELDGSLVPNQLCETILNHLEQPLIIKDIEVQLRFYCGISLYPDHGTVLRTILRRTHIAADYARSQHKRLHCYEPGQDEARLEQLAMVEALNTALKSNSNELYLHFQPKVNLQNNSVTAVETLIRWHRPGTGNVRPDIFINLAEQAGLIVPLTRWVIHQTMNQLKAWHQQGLQLQAAINVSAEDICHPLFCQMMEQAIVHANIEPKYCTIEITERDIMYDEAVGLMTLKTLKKIGFKIALDDYGVGQSTLAKLKDFPIDELKLDKEFIMTLDKSDKNQKIVKATIGMAHSLGLNVVAEGLENAESMQILYEMQCDFVQGYYIAKPMASAQLQTWLEDNDADYHLPVLAANK